NLKRGDFVVHTDYGIGQFLGLQYITVRERRQEVVRLSYRDRDTLYVNINALHKLHRYTGKEGHHPQLTKLGSGQWEKVKTRTRKRVKDIARDLIKLYAKRMATPGFAFQPDSVWQQEMEASFKYEDTPDQAEAAEAVKEDMMKPVPMDRLVCGDVGFGKTEIAIRAAFKAAQDGKQVAVLVPTTVLADQHGETFAKRLAEFPIKVEVISRFRTKDEVKEILKGVKSGTVDILIGTHRIVSKDVEFKELGLMIIDEEQRFGVTVKEKLKHLRINVDTLTLTATPIPRTLQFSLLGARDLSIVATPPPNRQPIVTEIHSYSTDLIREAIQYEIDRGGQVFFIHNRVQSIEEMSATLRNLIPNARIQVAHGQMPGTRLEKVMTGFKEHKFDILLSTNIVENGLDIANANTIIIDKANHFGLAELHQIRGRVGRSDRKAFCYLLVPSIHSLTREARQRLNAIEEFSDLGSGFNLAMRDLDIRGAGNMLGAEQSGFIADVGFETYHKILDEAVQELRADEFAELFKDAPPPPPASETVVEIEAEALLPADYVSDTTERLNLYRQISAAADTGALAAIRDELADRFGEPPPAVDALLLAARLKLTGQSLRLAKVVFKNQRLFLSCPAAEQDQVFYKVIFKRLLASLTNQANRYVLKESRGGKLRAIIQDVSTPEAAEELLKSIAQETVGAEH
ncbi:MAG: transcription-repair coupling factor, partial [Rhodothermales bacterium]|nr:transcription-repair coupling factor [Rhodothermales bacterium]